LPGNRARKGPFWYLPEFIGNLKDGAKTAGLLPGGDGAKIKHFKK
jgi:hypothetical protein